MPKTYIITKENSEEIREAMKKRENAKYYKKLQAVTLRGEGKKNDEIGLITGYPPAYVSHLVSLYSKEGIASLLQDNRKGGNNRNMTPEEEKRFLSQFEEAARNGQIITISDIAAS
jgi:transposase